MLYLFWKIIIELSTITIGGLGITLLYTQDSGYGGNPPAPNYLYTTQIHSLKDELIVDDYEIFDNFEDAIYSSSDFTTTHIVII